MNQSVIPLGEIKEIVIEMFELVRGQVDDTKKAISDFNQDLCQEVLIQEKKVNALDLKIDKESEKIMALYSPVAIDLRFIISALNINTFLERIGDNTQGICNYIIEMDKPFHTDVLENSQLLEQFNIVLEMFDYIIEAYIEEDTSKAARVLTLDKKVDEINKNALDYVMGLIREDIDGMKNYLYMLSMIRKTERIGDLIKNLAEETIFYIDAKVLKHKKKKTNKYIEKTIEGSED